MDKKQKKVRRTNAKGTKTARRDCSTNRGHVTEIPSTIPNTELKNLGQVAEMAFQLHATLHGFIVNKPFGESSKYDFITDWSGNLVRVQVKSVTFQKNGVYKVMVAHGKEKAKYDSTHCDVIAAFVVPEKTWYIIPVNEVEARDLNLRPHKESNGKYEKYKEQWDMLR